MQTCTKCERELPEEKFYRDKHSPTGRCYRCKDCVKADQQARRRRPGAKERNNERWRRWYAKNRGHRAAYERRWREENPESVAATSRRGYERDPSPTKLSNAVRRSGAEKPRDGTGDFMRLLHRDPCSFCGGPGGSIDHIDPISRGGSIDWTNLTAACDSCNRSKKDRSVLEQLIRRPLGAIA